MTEPAKVERGITKVFVYGTLKKGCSNHDVLGNSRFLRETSIPGVMLHLGGFPAALPCDKGSRIYGEIYEIYDMKVWDALDHLEGHPTHFRRTEYQIGADDVFVYLYNLYNQNVNSRLWRCIPHGRWAGQETYAQPWLGFHSKLPGQMSRAGVIYLTDKIAGFEGTLNLITGEPLYYVGPKIFVKYNPVSEKYEFGHGTYNTPRVIEPRHTPWNGEIAHTVLPPPYSYKQDAKDPGEEVVTAKAPVVVEEKKEAVNG